MIVFFLFLAVCVASVVDHKARIQALEEKHVEISSSTPREYHTITKFDALIRNQAEWDAWYEEQKGWSGEYDWDIPDMPLYCGFPCLVYLQWNLHGNPEWMIVLVRGDAIKEASELLEVWVGDET